MITNILLTQKVQYYSGASGEEIKKKGFREVGGEFQVKSKGVVKLLTA